MVDGSNGLDPFRLVYLQVFRPQDSSALLQKLDDAAAGFAMVEFVGTSTADPLQGVCQIRHRKYGTRLWGRVVGQEDACGFGFSPKLLLLTGEIAGQRFRNGQAHPGQLHRGRQRFRPGNVSESLQCNSPTADCTGNRHRQRTGSGHTIMTFLTQVGQGLCGTGTSGPVETVDRRLFGVVVEEEHVAANAVHVGARHGQDTGHGDSSVHRVPALL